jgi:hypothetical protein
MYQSYFELNIDKYEHMKALENKMSHAYARFRLTLYRDHYKKHLEGIDTCDAETIVRAKNVRRKIVPIGNGIQQWKLICDSFDDESWKVNIYYYTN